MLAGDGLIGFRGDKDRDYSPQGQIRLAGVLLEELITFSGTWTGPWVEERKQVCFRSFASPLPNANACIPVRTVFTRRMSESGKAPCVHGRGERVGRVRVDLGSERPSLVSVHSI